MLLTDAVFQAEMSLLNVGALKNMAPMLLTDAIFQLPMSWLKVEGR